MFGISRLTHEASECRGHRRWAHPPLQTGERVECLVLAVIYLALQRSYERLPLQTSVVDDNVLRALCRPGELVSTFGKWTPEADRFPGVCLFTHLCRSSRGDHTPSGDGLPSGASKPSLCAVHRLKLGKAITNDCCCSKRTIPFSPFSAPPSCLLLLIP